MKGFHSTTIFLYQFLGFMWNLTLFIVVIPYLLVRLSQGLDLYLYVKVFGIEPLVIPSSMLFSLLGLTIIALGFLIILEASTSIINKAHGFPFSIAPHYHLRPNKLLDIAWYGKVRHPIVLGYVIMLVGLGVFFASPSMLLWWIPLVTGLLLEYQLMVEEPRLVDWFGEEYQEYQRRVPPLVPNLPFGRSHS